MRLSLAVVLIAAAFFVGVNLGSLYRVPTIAEAVDEAGVAALTTKVGFTPVKVSMEATTVSLSSGCMAIQFDITPDQAYSITTALTNTSTQRPLTHDIFVDVLSNFNVTVMQANIDRYEEEIYKATIYMRRGNDVLALDARPSDAIAVSVRSGAALYIKDDILQQQGTNIC